MNTLVVSQYYYPEPFLIHEIAVDLLKRGHTVTVLTGLPNYPEGKILPPYKCYKSYRENIDGVDVIRVPMIGRGRGRMSLVLNYLSFAFFASIFVKNIKEDFDVVFCYQLSPVTVVYPAVLLKNKFNIPLFLYCLDLWPESTLLHIKNRDSWIYKCISKISKELYCACDRIGVTSKSFISYLSDVNGIDKDKMCYIPQHADMQMIDMDLSVKNDKIISFMYAGNLGIAQNIECIIKAAVVLKDKGKDFLVYIVGYGSNLKILQNMVQLNRLGNNIIFCGRYSSKEMPGVYKRANALLITLCGDNFVSYTLPAKLQTYMTTNKPIFGAINGAAKEIIREADCGFVVDADDYIGLADIMSDFIENPNKYTDCGKNARKYFIQHFTKECFIDNIEKEMLGLISK